jgi:hypothetical protein
VSKVLIVHFIICKQEERFYLINSKEPEVNEILIEENIEQADQEFSFNWVIDYFWRIFGTILGACIAPNETESPGISKVFHNNFVTDFMKPLEVEW